MQGEGPDHTHCPEPPHRTAGPKYRGNFRRSCRRLREPAKSSGSIRTTDLPHGHSFCRGTHTNSGSSRRYAPAQHPATRRSSCRPGSFRRSSRQSAVSEAADIRRRRPDRGKASRSDNDKHLSGSTIPIRPVGEKSAFRCRRDNPGRVRRPLRNRPLSFSRRRRTRSRKRAYTWHGPSGSAAQHPTRGGSVPAAHRTAYRSFAHRPANRTSPDRTMRRTPAPTKAGGHSSPPQNRHSAGTAALLSNIPAS